MLAGYDQKSNVVLSDSKERVYSMDEGVEEVPLGLYLVKGDMMCVLPAAYTPSLYNRLLTIVIVSVSCHLLRPITGLIISVFLFFFTLSASSLARLMKKATMQSTSLLSVPNPSHPFDTKGTHPPSLPLFPTFYRSI